MNFAIISSLIITFLIFMYYFQHSHFFIIALYTFCLSFIYLFNNYILTHWNYPSFNIDLSPYKASNFYLFLFSSIFITIFYYFIYKTDIISFVNNHFSFNKEYIDDYDDTDEPSIPNPDPTPTKPDPKMKCFVSKETSSDNKLILFYATWCKYSKEICLDWQEFVESNHLHDLSILAINCDDSDNPHELASKYNVEGYPTVILHIAKSDNIYHFNEKITVSKLNNFIKYTCDKEQLKSCFM